ncbi:GNAT family N-acetyltransferase [Dokdonia sp. Hel_I_53]|uniref:GNAT family N-acetyltransferase n=1 Tax=Dokdonia sp. Hel_I_53 TaxID=1566287 RepID=UPI00119C8773|nr:GNAT family N-acetyltransferase [Dokdonia sp. Hel_I_53]TVZ53171.1 RimJ/RimL family protein N-acetyltransferase [Dokdonia sp. Hel_I_53]
MKKILETDRLYLRQFIKGDTLDLFQLNNNPEVLRFTGDVPFTSSQETQAFIDHYFKNVYYNPTNGAPTHLGRLAVMRKTDHVFLGWCGLKFNSTINAVDLGFRFHQYFWNRGFATESARKVIEYAFRELKLIQLIAHAHINNKASQVVLIKCGFTEKEQIIYDNQPTLLYYLKNTEFELREITAAETWPVRHPVLRKNRPLEDVYMESDEKESTFHLGVFHNSKIVGVASFMEDTHPDFSGFQSRLRGMAVLDEYRKKGIARWLLEHGEKILKNRNRSLLWFNARANALSFYKNLGYKMTSEEFHISQVGPHYTMKKEL